ncbi:hypothetical protein PM082_010626 [Marasmius tenuissimus]|nr:hypothetical protein PM082_010626 [Marasmius tenuissimus]
MEEFVIGPKRRVYGNMSFLTNSQSVARRMSLQSSSIAGGLTRDYHERICQKNTSDILRALQCRWLWDSRTTNGADAFDYCFEWYHRRH